MQHHGKGLELLGTILATAGWASAALAATLVIAAFMSGLDRGTGAVIVGFLGALIGALALAGLGHLLRAVAQLGRNVHRLGAMLRERPGPPG